MPEPKRELYPTPPDEKPVEPIAWPDRLSQTLLRHENRCPRSAYLYVKTAGQVRSHEMDRGTLAHACAERLMLDLIMGGAEEGPERAGQAAPYTLDTELPTDAQESALSMQTVALVAEVRRELEAAGRVHISAEQADIARVCTFHLAMGLDVDPGHVLALERKFVLDLPCGWEVSVKADLISTPEPGLAVVDDYKTSLHAPADSEWDAFQVKVGAVALLYGYPIELITCGMCSGAKVIDGVVVSPEGVPSPATRSCPVCGGRGRMEHRGERLGGSFQRVRGRELYPRQKLRRDGKLHRNWREWTRLELDEFHADLNAAGERVLERLESWKWPARKGAWCTECPAESECPLPREMRDFEGAIETAEQARRLWEWSLAWIDRAGKVQAQVKRWAKASVESVVVGDESWAWMTTESRAVRRAGKTADWDGLVEAVRRAATLGEEFDVEHWIKTNRRTEFKKTTVPADQRSGEVRQDVGDGDAGLSADERWGADAPW